MSAATCRYCGRQIAWTRSGQSWTAVDPATIDDEDPSLHWQDGYPVYDEWRHERHTCREYRAYRERSASPPPPRPAPPPRSAPRPPRPPQPIRDGSVAEALAEMGLRLGASADDIDTTYRREAMRRHPDRGGSHDVMVRLTVAMEYLVAAGQLGEGRRERQQARRSR